MPTISDTFRTLHRLRLLARDLQGEIDRAPMQLKARQTVAAKPVKARDDGKDALKKLQVTIREREADLKAQHKQLGRYREQQSGAVDQKQFEALKHEITATEARCGELENQILDSMTRAEELGPQIPAMEQAAIKAQAEFETFQKEQKERLNRLSEELKKTLEELKKAEEPIPPDVRPEYTRRVASYGADALASAGANSCSHCHTTIAAQVILNLQMGQFVTCATCFRALYLPE